jgi:carbon storage regulator CsrA
MRVYTREVNEGLVIDNHVQVNVLEVLSDCVRLAIIDHQASPSYREELLFLPREEDSESEFESSSFAFEEDFNFEDQDSHLISMV